jgi:hypothetical protein
LIGAKGGSGPIESNILKIKDKKTGLDQSVPI